MIMFAKVLESDEYKKEHYGSLTLCVETKRKPETFITIKSLSCLFIFFFVVLCPFREYLTRLVTSTLRVKRFISRQYAQCLQSNCESFSVILL